MFCKVCIDAGKPEEVYASHRVKDLFGTVICPTLLNQKCLLCGVLGHTVKYCVESTNQGLALISDQPPTEWVGPECHVCRDESSEPCCNCLWQAEVNETDWQEVLEPKFCPVCRDAGREHQDHNLKMDGEIVCEYLKNTKCRNCGEYGHTPKYCEEPKKVSPAKRLRESSLLCNRIEQSLSRETKTLEKKTKKGKYVRVL